MPAFGSRSISNLSQLHVDLQRLLKEAIKQYDFTILDAQRGRAEQELAYKRGNTRVHFGNSAHNWEPAVACDIVPYPLDWNDVSRFRAMQMGIIKPLAAKLNIPIRLGCDWDRDGETADESFVDWPHIELHPWREWAKKSKPIEG